MYHLRYILPPTKKNAKGEEMHYLYRVFIPDFGTDYSASNIGYPNDYLFHERHFRSGTGLHKGSLCAGATLPLFRSMRGPYIGNAYNRPVYYSSYGKNVPDPFSLLMGHAAPLQEFALL